MLKAILFDIDNTLILFDEITFFRNYLPMIYRSFADLMPFELFKNKLLTSSQDLLENDGKMSNADFFMNSFSRGFENYKEEMWNRFIKFYDTEFDKFETLTTPVKGVSDIISQLQKQNFKLVIASNPLWPLNVQIIRLGWAGIQDINYHLITHIQNMSFCKPRLEYYWEICSKINEKPEHCLMVGNDPFNDTIVGKIGMKTFLTDDSNGVDGSSLLLSREIGNRTSSNVPEPDFSGPFHQILGAINFLLKTDDG
jgi:FMN phosphatase YigB (HAD superfamily)